MLVLAFVVACAASSRADETATTPAAPEKAAPAATKEQSTTDDPTAPREEGFVETVEVEGRLGAGEERRAATVSDTVLGPDDIRAAPERSTSQLLARLPAVNAADETGNGRQLSLELRGFAGSAGATAVTLDGLRINEPDTNVVSWETVRLEDLERVEIRSGPQAALGGGSLAGAVHLERRRPPTEPVLDVVASGGTFDLGEIRAFGGGPVGRVRLAASGSLVREGGFRDGADVEENAGRVALATTVAAVDLQLDVSHVHGHWAQPGALTAEELAADPSQSTWNALDHQDARQDLVTLRAERTGAPRTSWLAVAGYRTRASTILASGRTCYGFTTDDSVQDLQVAAEAATRIGRVGPSTSAMLRWGAELSRDRMHPEGFATDDTCDGEIHAEEPWSDVDVAWDRAAVFATLEASVPHGVTLEAGLRHDRSRVAREGEEFSDAAVAMVPVEGHRSFADTVAQLGVTKDVRIGRADGIVHARWAQSFLPPSALQLFAYPGFFSNPDLSPQRGSGPTVGATFHGASWTAGAELFETDVDDEIAYDDASRRNVNAGRTRRRGAELRVELRPHAGVRVALDAVLTRATFRGDFASGGVKDGAAVPLVPRHDARLALDLGPWKGASGSLALTDVGEAALSNDFDASSPTLARHRVLDASVRKTWGRASTVEVSLSATNLLDARYVTRGIETPQGSFFTPAPPRAITLAVGIHK